MTEVLSVIAFILAALLVIPLFILVDEAFHSFYGVKFSRWCREWVRGLVVKK